jgi:fucose permease
MSGTRGGSKVVAGSSLGFGAVLAMVMSWTLNQSILWAVIHGVFGWIYVIYYMIVRDDWKFF